MAKSKKIVFSDIVFNRQVDAEVYVRELLICFEGRGFIDSSSVHWPFLSELLARHPDYDEKRGNGILKFHIGRSAYKQIELNLERVDGTFCDVSWRKCVTGRPTSILGNLKAAMRVIIEPQINDFKNKNYSRESICEICHNLLDELERAHVDHVNHFDTLAEGFILINPHYPKEFDDEALTNRAKFRDADAEFGAEWSEYHYENAKLRIVHSECNLRRKKAKKLNHV